MKTVLHGEVGIYKIKELPKGLIKKKDFKLADSETSGNHHMLQEKEGVELYEKDGVLYIKNDVPADVYCVIKERHDTITLEPGIWEVEPQQEWDYLTQEKRHVAD